MARLNQRAFNNLVIVLMLIMIALFNLDRFLPNDTTAQQRPLLDPAGHVLAIEQDGFKLERAGQQWRVKGVDKPSGDPIQQFQAWQRALLIPIDTVSEQVTQQNPLIVVVWSAGKIDGDVYAFYPQADATLVNHQQQWFELANTTLNALLPWSEFNDA